ncbi:MAG TPA: MBOAT family protein, partial [Stellaceae bacterium]|nr:MBOAT family protein [Stellaceae bacterium]
MLFPTLGFLVFFLIVAAAMIGLERHFTAKKAVLVAASYFFYAQWDWHFCFLLAFSSAVSYLAGWMIGASRDPRRRRAVLVAAIAVDLAVLGVFKYFDFFLLTANRLAQLLGLQQELPFFEI